MNPDANDTSHQPAEQQLRQMEQLVSWILRIGVTLSLLLVTAGTIVSFYHHADYVHSEESLRRLTSPNASEVMRSPGEVFGKLTEFRGQAIVVAGLLMLIATPILRVAASILAFAKQRDWFFAVITSIVLVLLMISFLLGKVG